MKSIFTFFLILISSIYGLTNKSAGVLFSFYKQDFGLFAFWVFLFTRGEGCFEYVIRKYDDGGKIFRKRK